MHRLKLYYKDGRVDELKWGAIPDVFYMPDIFRPLMTTESMSKKEMQWVPQKKEFHLCGIEDRRFLWYTRKIGHYVEV